MKRLLSSLCLCVLFVSAIPAEAARKNPAIHAYKTAMAEMHRHMNVHYSGDPDTDFVRGMIPHHQGAIDMAKILLKHGNNLELRELAEDIVASQGQEIARMEKWLATQNYTLKAQPKTHTSHQHH